MDLFQLSDIDTQTYLFLDDVLQQDGEGLQDHANWGEEGPDWEMDPKIVIVSNSDAFDLRYGSYGMGEKIVGQYNGVHCIRYDTILYHTHILAFYLGRRSQ